jgi:hypothetical protein
VNLKELLGDPSWLFDLGFPVLEFSEYSNAKELESLEWELDDVYRVPPLSSLSEERRFAEASMAWNDEGLMLHIVAKNIAQTQTATPLKTSSHPMSLTFYLDTRRSPGMHRASNFCHRFEFLLNPSSSTQLVRGHGELSGVQRARSNPNAIHPKDIFVGSLKRTFGYEIKAFLRGDTLTGFEPREYQEIGLFFVLNDPTNGSQCLARNRQSPFFEDPSLWCRGALIQPQ